MNILVRMGEEEINKLIISSMKGLNFVLSVMRSRDMVSALEESLLLPLSISTAVN